MTTIHKNSDLQPETPQDDLLKLTSDAKSSESVQNNTSTTPKLVNKNTLQPEHTTSKKTYHPPFSQKNKFQALTAESELLSEARLLELRMRNLRYLINYYCEGNITTFANQYGFTRCSVSLILNGKSEFTTAYAQKFAKACQLPAYSIDIVDEEEFLHVLNSHPTQVINTPIGMVTPNTQDNVYPVKPITLAELKSRTQKAGRPRTNYVKMSTHHMTQMLAAKTVTTNAAITSTNPAIATTGTFTQSPTPTFSSTTIPNTLPEVTQDHKGKTIITLRNGEQVSGIFLDMLDAEVSAGPGTYTNDYINSDRVFISDYEYYRYLSSENPSKLKVLKINGDSMEPVLKNGQTCIVRLVERFTNTGIYVFTYSGVTYIKRLMTAKNHIIAVSENSNYPPFLLEEDSLIIHGKLVLALDYTPLN